MQDDLYPTRHDGGMVAPELEISQKHKSSRKPKEAEGRVGCKFLVLHCIC
jgi:hypothetical protein